MPPTTGDPGGLFGWWQLASATFALPGSVILAGAVWRVWLWYFGRSDKNRETEQTTGLSLQQQLRVDIQANRERIDTRTDRLFERQAAMLAEEQKENHELRNDRDRGWALARYWYWRFRDQFNQLRNAQTIALAASRRLVAAGLIADIDMPTFDPLPAVISDLEDPIPRQVSP